MTDAEDNGDSLIPTELDLARLQQLQPDGRVESENQTWVALRYPAKPGNWKWCEYSLLVNHPDISVRSAPYELKNLKSLLMFLEQLEEQRLADG